MGNKIATFTEEQFEEYQDCTNFARKEIQDVYKKFYSINPQVIPEVMSRWDCQVYLLSILPGLSDRFCSYVGIVPSNL